MADQDDFYIQAIRGGDRNGLEQIYKEFVPAIMRLVCRNGGTREDARDVFQTALIVIFQRSREGKLELSGSFSGLLYGICRNIWGNRLQKKSFQEVSLPEEIKYTLQAPWEDRIVKEEKNQLLRDQMNNLGDSCRKILELFFSGKSMEEIRQEMDFASIGYAMKRKFVCKERLIELIKKDQRFGELIQK